jgi:two-component system, NarL family, response regulator NreC
MSAHRTRVLLAEDHTLVRQALRCLLERESDIEVVGEAADGREAVKKATSLKPDVVIMDVCMPRLNGIEATVRIVAAVPEARVVALSMDAAGDYVHALLKAGARGFVLKESSGDDLMAAIRAVRGGGTYLHPNVSTQVIEGLLQPARPKTRDRLDTLTAREKEVLQLIAEGFTNRRIATELGVSVKTVDAHRTRLMAKLRVHNTADLTRCAIRLGLAKTD